MKKGVLPPSIIKLRIKIENMIDVLITTMNKAGHGQGFCSG